MQGKGLFASEAVWLNIDPAVTFADLAGNLFEVLGKPLLGFHKPVSSASGYGAIQCAEYH